MAALLNHRWARMMKYKLNDGLKLKALAATFKKTGRVRVMDALDEKSADNLSETIETMAIWRSTFLDGETERVISGQEAQAMMDRRRREMRERLYTQAKEGFQYLRYECPTDVIPDAKDPKALADADVFFKSDGFRDFLRKIAGGKTGALENVHARWLDRDQFRSDSSLDTDPATCKLHFAMDVTRTWKPHWGGHLNFLASDGEIEEAWSPGFNRLQVYAGGIRHSIGYVAPFKNAHCLSICGRLV